MIACKLCKREFRNFLGLTNHVDEIADRHALRVRAGLKPVPNLEAHFWLSSELEDVSDRFLDEQRLLPKRSALDRD